MMTDEGMVKNMNRPPQIPLDPNPYTLNPTP
jgi:hypothetical protein